MNDSRVMVLKDGRDLGWLESGDPSGVPVIAFHGTPGSRLQVSVFDEAARAAGVRLICPDRPGYGLSTFQPSRRLTQWSDDVRELVDHMGIDTFAVLGVSGGGPHALVCAALLGGRITVTGVASGVGPLNDARALDGMSKQNRTIFQLSQKAPWLLLSINRSQMSFARRYPRRAVDFMLKQVPEADAALLRQPSVRAIFEMDLARASHTVPKAATQDIRVFASDWGFKYDAIAVPVHFWHGTADRSVPLLHARIQHEQIRNSQLHEFDDEGHLMIFNHINEILDKLLGN